MIRSILDKIAHRTPLHTLDVLDCFGGQCHFQSRHLDRAFMSLTIWEHNKKDLDAIQEAHPHADVKTCDAFEEIKVTEKKFDLVLMDHSISMSGKHVENFDLFPHVFRVLKDHAFIVPQLTFPGSYYCRHNQGVVPDHILEERKLFFAAYTVRGDGDYIPLGHMVDAYIELVNEYGFSVIPQGSTLMARNIIHFDWFYLLLELQRKK